MNLRVGERLPHDPDHLQPRLVGIINWRGIWTLYAKGNTASPEDHHAVHRGPRGNHAVVVEACRRGAAAAQWRGRRNRFRIGNLRGYSTIYRHILFAVDLEHDKTWAKSLPTSVEYAQAFASTLHVMTVVPDFDMSVVGSFFPKEYEKKGPRSGHGSISCAGRRQCAEGGHRVAYRWPRHRP